MNPAIFIIAISRPEALKRLLSSLLKADYLDGKIPLVICLDHPAHSEVTALAENFEWPNGPKEVRAQKEHMGLKAHLMQCGNLLETYGRGIFLEDDLAVAPNFYKYASKALEYYQKEEKVGGISLYTYEFSENGFLPFRPTTFTEVHFIQVASSWGQAWTWEQWQSFTDWLNTEPKPMAKESPGYMKDWGGKSWKKWFTTYLIQEEKYFVFPPRSYSTNFEDKGTHSNTKGLFQVQMEQGKTLPDFMNPSDSTALFDAWFEPLPQCLKQLSPALAPHDFDVDLYGSKEPVQLKSALVLTSRNGKDSVLEFSDQLFPKWANVTSNTAGKGIRLLPKEKVIFDPPNPRRFFRLASIVDDVFSDQWEKPFRIRVVIPVEEMDQKWMLENSLTALTKQTHPYFNIILPVDQKHKKDLEAWLLSKPFGALSIAVIPVPNPINTWSLLNAGFKNSIEEGATWLREELELVPDALAEVATIFSQHQQINWLKFEKREHSHISVGHRLNQQLARRTLKNSGYFPPLYRMFWRGITLENSGLFSDTHVDAGIEFFLRLIEKEKLYPVNRGWISTREPKFHGFKAKDGQKLLEIHPYAPPSISWTILSRLVLFLLLWMDTHYLRGFYALLYDLPGVLHLDEENGTFRLEQY